ncbi:MAG: S4 domain-containing protein [Mollicutes bacterium]|nr:MAG: S4 domain-containing protein [Mollicutes bacterium]
MLQAEMVSSLSEARRLIEQGGIQIANRTVRHVFYQIKPKDLVNSHLILRFGKKRYYLINFED